MECAEREHLDVWMSHWADMVDCEVVPVITSAEAARKVPELDGTSTN